MLLLSLLVLAPAFGGGGKIIGGRGNPPLLDTVGMRDMTRLCFWSTRRSEPLGSARSLRYRSHVCSAASFLDTRATVTNMTQNYQYCTPLTTIIQLHTLTRTPTNTTTTIDMTTNMQHNHTAPLAPLFTVEHNAAQYHSHYNNCDFFRNIYTKMSEHRSRGHTLAMTKNSRPCWSHQRTGRGKSHNRQTLCA